MLLFSSPLISPLPSKYDYFVIFVSFKNKTGTIQFVRFRVILYCVRRKYYSITVDRIFYLVRYQIENTINCNTAYIIPHDHRGGSSEI